MREATGMSLEQWTSLWSWVESQQRQWQGGACLARCCNLHFSKSVMMKKKHRLSIDVGAQVFEKQSSSRQEAVLCGAWERHHQKDNLHKENLNVSLLSELRWWWAMCTTEQADKEKQQLSMECDGISSLTPPLLVARLCWGSSTFARHCFGTTRSFCQLRQPCLESFSEEAGPWWREEAVSVSRSISIHIDQRSTISKLKTCSRQSSKLDLDRAQRRCHWWSTNGRAERFVGSFLARYCREIINLMMMLILTWRALGHYPPFCYAHWSNPREEMIDCSSRPQPEVFKVNEIVIFVGKVEVEVGKEGNSHCCFTLLLAHQVFDELMQKASNCIASLWWRDCKLTRIFLYPETTVVCPDLLFVGDFDFFFFI